MLKLIYASKIQLPINFIELKQTFKILQKISYNWWKMWSNATIPPAVKVQELRHLSNQKYTIVDHSGAYQVSSFVQIVAQNRHRSFPM